MSEGLSRRALLGLGLSRLRREDPDPRPESPAPPPVTTPPPVASPGTGPAQRSVLALEQADLNLLSGEPVAALAAAAAPQPGEDVVVVRGGELEDRFEEHDGLVAVVEPVELDDLPFADGEIHRALVPFALAYVPDPRAALGELFRALRPGGVLALTVWAPGGSVGRVLEAVPGWDPDIDARLGWGDADRLHAELAPLAAQVDVEPHELDIPRLTAAALERALPPVAAALAGFPGADANGLRAHADRLIAENAPGAPDARYLLAVARLHGR